MGKIIAAEERHIKDGYGPKLECKYPIKAAFETTTLILKCFQHSKEDQPSMNEGFKTLERIFTC